MTKQERLNLAIEKYPDVIMFVEYGHTYYLQNHNTNHLKKIIDLQDDYQTLDYIIPKIIKAGYRCCLIGD